MSRLEENDLQHEKLSVLRKFQKQKEKRQILRERIESESTQHQAGGSPSAGGKNAANQSLALQKAKMTSNVDLSGVALAHSIIGQKVAAASFAKDGKKNTMLLQDSQSVTNFDKSATQGNDRSQTLMMMAPGSLSVLSGGVAEVHMASALDSFAQGQETQGTLVTHLQRLKSEQLMRTERLESLLLRADTFFAEERARLIKSLRYHDEQITDKERSIQVMLTEIAECEMRRNVVSDELEDNLLRTIEVINISDIRIERENMEREIIDLERKQQELEKQESDLLKERERLDEKRRRRRAGAGGAQNTGPATTAPAK